MSFTDQRGLVIIFSNQADTDDSPPSSPPSYSPTSPSLPSHSPGLATSHSPTTANHSHPPTSQPPPPPQPASPLPQVVALFLLFIKWSKHDLTAAADFSSHLSKELTPPTHSVISHFWDLTITWHQVFLQRSISAAPLSWQVGASIYVANCQLAQPTRRV